MHWSIVVCVSGLVIVNMSKPNTLKAHRLSAEFAEKRGQTTKKIDPSNP